MLCAALQFTGTIPAAFQDLQSLQLMDLSDNQLTGPLPQTFAFDTSLPLTALWLQGNALSGAGWGCSPLSLASLGWIAVQIAWLRPGLKRRQCSIANERMPVLQCIGTLPTWPDAKMATLTVLPGNEGLCGDVSKLWE